MRSLLVCAGLWLAGASPVTGLLFGCSCTTESVSGVTAIVRNANTAQPIDGATLVLVDGAHRETMEAVPGQVGTYWGAREREGDYTLTVTAPRFRPSAPRTIEVNGDVCHVRPETVTIDLTPL